VAIEEFEPLKIFGEGKALMLC